jgi:hypothetical protein
VNRERASQRPDRVAVAEVRRDRRSVKLFAQLALESGLAVDPFLELGRRDIASNEGPEPLCDVARGFGLVALVVAVLLSTTVISLMRRDAPHQDRLTVGVRSGDATVIVAGETSRMAEVIGRYPSYRIAALGLGALALLAVALSRRGWVNGAAAGVLVLVVAQVVIDHYSEARARRYSGELRAIGGGPAADGVPRPLR